MESIENIKQHMIEANETIKLTFKDGKMGV